MMSATPIFFCIILLIISYFFYKKDLKKISLLKKFLTFALKNVSRANRVRNVVLANSFFGFFLIYLFPYETKYMIADRFYHT